MAVEVDTGQCPMRLLPPHPISRLSAVVGHRDDLHLGSLDAVNQRENGTVASQIAGVADRVSVPKTDAGPGASRHARPRQEIAPPAHALRSRSLRPAVRRPRHGEIQPSHGMSASWTAACESDDEELHKLADALAPSRSAINHGTYSPSAQNALHEGSCARTSAHCVDRAVHSYCPY